MSSHWTDVWLNELLNTSEVQAYENNLGHVHLHLYRQEKRGELNFMQNKSTKVSRLTDIFKQLEKKTDSS